MCYLSDVFLEEWNKTESQFYTWKSSLSNNYPSNNSIQSSTFNLGKLPNVAVETHKTEHTQTKYQYAQHRNDVL